MDGLLACTLLVVAIVADIVTPARCLVQAREGDAGAFADLVTPHLAAWVGAARRVVGADADDVVNRVLEKLWAAVQKNELTIENLSAYGRRAVVNEGLDLLRSRKREVPASVDESAGGGDPLDEVLAREGTLALDRTLMGLPEEDRRIVQMRAFESRPFEEIARSMGKTSEWARKRYQRACEKLHETAKLLLGVGRGS